MFFKLSLTDSKKEIFSKFDIEFKIDIIFLWEKIKQFIKISVNRTTIPREDSILGVLAYKSNISKDFDPFILVFPEEIISRLNSEVSFKEFIYVNIISYF